MDADAAHREFEEREKWQQSILARKQDLELRRQQLAQLESSSSSSNPSSSSAPVGSSASSPSSNSQQQQQQAQPDLSSALEQASLNTGASKKRVILLMTVEIGDGRTDTIEVKEGDEPRDLAIAFCQRNSLAENVVDPLSEHIRVNVAALPPSPSKPSSSAQSSSSSSASNSNSNANSQYQSFSSSSQAELFTGSSSSSSASLSKSRNRPGSAKPESRFAASAITGRPGSALAQLQTRGRDPAESDPLSQNTPRSPLHSSRRSFGSFNHNSPNAVNSNMTGKPMIDEHSRRLVERNGLNSKPVHIRLHEQAQARKAKLADEAQKSPEGAGGDSRGVPAINWVSKSMMKDRSAGDHRNYCERLYLEGLRKRQELLLKAEQKKQEEEKDPEATFRPQISDKARGQQRSGAHTWQRIVDYKGDNAMTRKKELEASLKLKQEQECTFAPAIDKKSAELMKKKESILHERYSTHFDQLYEDAKRRFARNEEFEHWYPDEVTFHPDIGSNKRLPRLDSDFDSFIDRLVHSRDQTERELEEIRKKQSEPIDPKTGQPFFKPIVNERKPASAAASANNSNNNSNMEQLAEEIASPVRYRGVLVSSSAVLTR